jgi:hypothetical protein
MSNIIRQTALTKDNVSIDLIKLNLGGYILITPDALLMFKDKDQFNLFNPLVKIGFDNITDPIILSKLSELFKDE